MNPRHRSRRGFTLVEILIVIVIFGLIMTMAGLLLRSVAVSQKRSVATTRLAGVEAALVQFVMQKRRLPCPADGTDTSATAGVEQRLPSGNCQPNTQIRGIVPWKTLGISSVDATDGWDRYLTYRVEGSLVKDDGMNLSMCDPAGTGAAFGGNNACNPGCVSTNLASCTSPTNFLTGKGLNIKSVAGTDLMLPTGATPTGAAYVLISHGESGGGAYLPTGQLSASTVTDGTEEQKNYASLALGTYYVDDQLSDVSGTTHFDDVVLRPSILQVAAKAALAPRSH